MHSRPAAFVENFYVFLLFFDNIESKEITNILSIERLLK